MCEKEPLVIRPATLADQPGIVALVHSAGINPLGLSWRRFLVADLGGRMAGIGQVKVHAGGSRELASIAVVPECQGRGIAGSIIRTLLASETGPVYLTCRRHLEPFYVHFGFHCMDSAAGMPLYFRLVFHAMALVSRLTRRPPGVIVMCKA